MRKIKISARFLAVGLALGTVTALHSYVLWSPARTWDRTPLYTVDHRGLLTSVQDGDNGATRVTNALNSLNAWNGAGAGRLAIASKGYLPFSSTDGIPTLNFDDPASFCVGNCVARTYYMRYSQRSDGTYRTYDADIVTNSGGFSFTSEGEDPGGVGCSNEIYVEGLMVHEMGHAIGLDHTNVQSATMWPYINYCDNSWATTEADDENGVLALHGAAPCTACDRYHGDLTGTGDIEYEPDSYYYYGFADTHTAWLVGPSGTNFNLYLEHRQNGVWTTVAMSTGSSSSEYISYYGPAGDYRWRVSSASGRGIYRFYWAFPWSL